MASSLSQRAPIAAVDSTVEEVAGIGRVFRSFTAKGKAHQKMLDELDKHRVMLVNKALHELAQQAESAFRKMESDNEKRGKISKAAHAVGRKIKDGSANDATTAAVTWVGERWTIHIHNVIAALEDRNNDAEFNKDEPDGGSSWDRDEKPLLSFSGRWRKRIYVNVMRNKGNYDHQRSKGVQMEGREIVAIGKHYADKHTSAVEEAGGKTQSGILEKEGLPSHPLLAAAKRLSQIKVTSTKQRYYKMVHRAISPSKWYKMQMAAFEKKAHVEHASTFSAAEIAAMAAFEVYPELAETTSKLPSTLIAMAAIREEAAMDAETDDTPWVLEVFQTGPAKELAMVSNARELVVIREVSSVVQGAHKMPVSAQGNIPGQRVTMFLCEDQLVASEIAMLQAVLSSKTGVDVTINFSKLA